MGLARARRRARAERRLSSAMSGSARRPWRGMRGSADLSGLVARAPRRDARAAAPEGPGVARRRDAAAGRSRETVSRDHLAVPVKALFGDPRLGAVVDEDKPETLGVAELPLEVVQ